MPLLRLGIGTFRSRTRPSTMMSVEPSRNQRKVGSGSAFALQVTVSGIVSTVTFIIFFDIVIFSGGTVERIKIRIKVAVFLYIYIYRKALWTSIRTVYRIIIFVVERGNVDKHRPLIYLSFPPNFIKIEIILSIVNLLKIVKE